MSFVFLQNCSYKKRLQYRRFDSFEFINVYFKVMALSHWRFFFCNIVRQINLNRNATRNQDGKCNNWLLSIANKQLLFNYCYIFNYVFLFVFERCWYRNLLLRTRKRRFFRYFTKQLFMKSFEATILFWKLNKKYPNTKIFFNSVPATWLKGYQQRGCQGKAIKTAAT